MTLVFFGTPEFAVPSLRRLCEEKSFRIALVVSQPDRPVGRRQTRTPPPVARFARERGLPLLQPEKVRGDADFLARLRREAPDFLVVVAYGKILPREILEVPRIAPVNVHASLLPKYRGASPIAAALLAGEHETGVSVMEMTAGLDEGPVYAVRNVAIDDSDDAASLSEKLAREGAGLLAETLPGIAAGDLAARPQVGEASYCRTIRKGEGEIDWSRPAAEIERKRRAFTPWPGIFTYLGSERVKILESHQGGRVEAAPGTIIRCAEDTFSVACGQATSLRPRLLQREGRRAVTAAEFLRALPSANARFGR